MSIVIFILVLVALIVVHELGHFIVAKLSGMRVDEFGVGYPPRVWGFKKGETEYTLNWLPFGGFVKIFGEDMEEKLAENKSAEQDPRAFSARPRLLQALTLFAGIAMNLLFAYVLITATLLMSTPRSLAPEEVATAKNVSLAVAGVLPESPAAKAGLVSGDYIQSASYLDAHWSGSDADTFTEFVGKDTDSAPISVTVLHKGTSRVLNMTPQTGVLSVHPERAALGVQLAQVGVVPVSLTQAPVQGAVLTWDVTRETALALTHFFVGLFTFSADLSQVSGPIGIAGAVGSASAQGLASLMTITALISINLALINVLPIPALDGGRLFFVLVEAITRKPIKARLANTMNTVGFGLLVLLMLVVTAHDVFKIFS
jgi:regulator of sigma E protease